MHIILKTGIENKKKILKAAREKIQVTYKSKPIRKIYFSIEILKARRAWNDD
jgi:hypothetical protein